MPPIGLARRPAVRPAGRAARAGLVLLVALASLSVVSRLQVPPTERTIAVGRVPTAVAVDAHTRRVFASNAADAGVSRLDARGGRVLRTIPLGRTPGPIAVDERTDHVLLAGAPLLGSYPTGAPLLGPYPTGAQWSQPHLAVVSLLDA